MLSSVSTKPLSWYVDIVNYLTMKCVSQELNYHHRQKLQADSRYYFWDELYLFKLCSNQLIRRCIDNDLAKRILRECQEGPVARHHAAHRIVFKVLQSAYYIGLQSLRTFFSTCANVMPIRKEETWVKSMRCLNRKF